MHDLVCGRSRLHTKMTSMRSTCAPRAAVPHEPCDWATKSTETTIIAPRWSPLSSTPTALFSSLLCCATTSRQTSPRFASVLRAQPQQEAWCATKRGTVWRSFLERGNAETNQLFSEAAEGGRVFLFLVNSRSCMTEKMR